MDYLSGQTLPKLAFYMLTVFQTSQALLDQLAEESFPMSVFPHLLGPAEESQASASCDFESPCSWSLSSHNKGADWHVTSPKQQRTFQYGFQPITDHSDGSVEGHYLLLNPRSASRGSKACEFHITSPVLPNSGPLCEVRLARFQPEPRMGNLSISILRANSSSVISSLGLSSTGNDGNRLPWEVVDALIGQLDESFQVMVRYSACGGDGGKLAIDSLELRDCERGLHDFDLGADCEEDSFLCDSGGCVDLSRVCDFHTDCPLGEDEGLICDSLPVGSHCSFEAGPCGWSVTDRQSQWTMASGEQLDEDSEDLIGSTLEHTQGHFLFLKVRGHDDNSEASIQSPVLPLLVSQQDCQLHFSIYLHGDFNGTVLLSVVENDTASSPPIWARAGQWTDTWHDVTLQIADILNGFHLRVQAVWGPSSNADIALDDITLSAACFHTDLNSLPLGHRLFHDLDSFGDLDFLSPLPEPSASEVSFMSWWFTSCGASGPRGPTQAQCDSAYRNTNVSVVVGKEGPLKGVQMWRVPTTDRYKISAYGAAGGKGAKNHNKRSHGVILSAVFPLEKGDILYILIGHQGEDACPGRNPMTQKICLGESSVIEDEFVADGSALEWAGGGGGGGGATYIFRMENGAPVPLLIAAGGGGKSYLEDHDSGLDQSPLEQYEKNTAASGGNGMSGAAGGGGGWRDSTQHLWAGKCLVEGAEGGSSCPQALSKLGWVTYGGFGGGGGACTAGGGGGGYRATSKSCVNEGGDTSLTDDITADGQDGVSFIHPSGEMYIQPLAAMESHGEAEIEVHLNCSHCQTQTCRRNEETRLSVCVCLNEEVLAPDNVTCTVNPTNSAAEWQPSLWLILAVVASTMVTGILLTCASLILMYYRKKNHLQAVRVRLESPEYKLSKIRSSTIMTDYNPNYCFAGKAASLSELKEVPRRSITLLRALGHGAFGEVYEGQVVGLTGDNMAMQVAIKTLPEICSEQDEMDFLMEALIMSKFSHQNIVRCIGVSLQILPRFILLELMTGGDMKSFLRQNRPKFNQPTSLSMLELLHMARDIALGCRYLEENHFIHRDIAARNCLLTCPGPDRVAKIGDFGMARDIYRASYYRKGGRAMLPVKWMPPEAFLEGIFTCKTDTWSFGVLLWEIFSLGYMPYPCKTNQEVLEFVTSGGRMDPPKSCPGPVYRIMTQCWQHCPEHRPNFSTILERINYCTQDPDVINTPLPVEYGPAPEEDGGTTIRPEGSGSMTPLLVAHPMSHDALPQPCAAAPPLQAHKPRLLLQKPSQSPPEVATYREPLELCWAETVPAPLAPGTCSGSWLHVPATDHRPCSRTSSSSGSHKLKNKTKNLWNPTYGSWVFESFSRGKTALAHTQSMPLTSTSSPLSGSSSTSERTDSTPETPTAPSHAASSSSQTPTLSTQGPPSHVARKIPSGAAGAPQTGIMDLAKLQSFPCGNVNYAYDEHSYETESLPLVLNRPVQGPTSSPPGASTLSTSTSVTNMGMGMVTGHKPLVKRHASYGHEDMRRHAKAEKPSRDRDSGFSLSEDLSVTPV